MTGETLGLPVHSLSRLQTCSIHFSCSHKIEDILPENLNRHYCLNIFILFKDQIYFFTCESFIKEENQTFERDSAMEAIQDGGSFVSTAQLILMINMDKFLLNFTNRPSWNNFKIKMIDESIIFLLNAMKLGLLHPNTILILECVIKPDFLRTRLR